jgi:hypothetical protein
MAAAPNTMGSVRRVRANFSLPRGVKEEMGNAARNACFIPASVYPEYGSELMRGIAIILCAAALLGNGGRLGAQAAPAKSSPVMINTGPAVPPKPRPLLPDAFAGWEAVGTIKTAADPAEADSANAAALKEYEFTSVAIGDYKRGTETLNIRALTFKNVSGAYGAYSFYRQNGWPKADIGAGGTSNKNRVLFWQGNTVVNAAFSKIGPMSAAELRELASHLPVPEGNKALAPPLLASLPQGSLDKQTTHYAEGPAGYAGAGGVLPPELVGFDRDAETVTANYSLRSGPATLTLIDYPTPQMAEAQEAKIREYIKAGKQAQPAWPKPLADSDVASLEVRRSGPLVALVSGDAIPDESHKLISTVHYEADLTAIPQPSESEVSKTGRLLMGIATIVIIGSSAAILLGFFLGGGRALYRIARGKPVSTVYDTEFIQLHLQD